MEGSEVMATIEKYITNSGVERSGIAVAVAQGAFSTEEIIVMCKDKRLKDAFLGEGYKNKLSKDKWNKDYVDELTCAAVAESFNRDYLLYLDEVSKYVREKEKKGSITWWQVAIGVAVVAIVIGVIVWKVYNSGQ